MEEGVTTGMSLVTEQTTPEITSSVSNPNPPITEAVGTTTNHTALPVKKALSPLASVLDRLRLQPNGKEVRRRFRPWPVAVAIVSAGVLAMVLAIVLVHVRDKKRQVAINSFPVANVHVPHPKPQYCCPFLFCHPPSLLARLLQFITTRLLPLFFLPWTKPVLTGCTNPKTSSTDINIARVNLGYIRYQGVPLENGINQYLGMRYAQPPIGDLRWRAPVQPDQVLEDQPATSFGKICLGISAMLPNDIQDEDCLFVNVWAPRNATVDSKLPVWLFIQGGGYTVNSNANWNGSEVVERSGLNMILVNFNYRVGAWGFLASERLRANGNLNVGLLDQRMMMMWVQKYIAQFGGDPNHVIIHGASAGAGSVALHLVANGGQNQNLFQGAIAESVFFPQQPPVAELEWQFDRFLSSTGCIDSGDPMDCLRGLDAAKLQAANFPSPFPSRTESPLPLFYWTPCVDGDFLPDLPYTMFDDGTFIDVPVILGSSNDEGSYFAINAATPDDVRNFFANNYPRLTDSDTSNIIQLYPQLPSLPFHEAWYPSASMAYGEATFICPGLNILNSQLATKKTQPAWAYRYNVIDGNNTAIGLGVPHLWESWAIFGPDSISGPGLGPASYYTYNAPIVPIVMDYWISFVKTLNPNSLKNPAAPMWEPWTASTTRLRFETDNSAMELAGPELLQRCASWRGLAPVTEQRKRADLGEF